MAAREETVFRIPALTFLQMLQPRIEDLFNAVELGTPHFFHLFKSVVDVVEASVHVSEAIIHVATEVPQMALDVTQPRVIEQDADEHGNHRGH